MSETSRKVAVPHFFFVFSYFLLELNPEKQRQAAKLKEGEIYSAVNKSLKNLHGEQGIAEQQGDLRIKYLNPETGIIFLRTRRYGHQKVKDAVNDINRIGNCVTKVKIIHVSGTMRSSQKRLLVHHRRQLLKMLGRCRTEKDRDAVRMAMEGLTDLNGKPTNVEEDMEVSE